MYKQLSEAYLGAAQAYAKLAEVEAIAIQNKQVAEQAQSELSLLKDELAQKDYEAAEYTQIRNILLNGRIGDYINIKTDVANVTIDSENYLTESEYAEALAYQELLVRLCDAVTEVRIGLGD